MEEQKKIQELEEELCKGLRDFGASYNVFGEETQGDKKIRGKHIEVTFPIKVKVDVKEITVLFEKYYGHIHKVSKVSQFTCGVSGTKRNSIVLDLEAN